MPCQVYLLAHTPDPDSLVAAASRICYSAAAVSDLLERESAHLSASLLRKLRRSGHHSPFEHASFTFGVDGLSRVASHQLVRHRLASYSQQSQRYMEINEAQVVVPPSIASNPEALALFQRGAAAAFEVYTSLLALGVKAEDARFILPHGWETRLVLTMNARELHHFFELRLCRRAQWEIRELARLMLIECRKAAPVVFETAGPLCVGEGRCHESRSCGKPYGNMEDLMRKDD